jgi:predicted DNA-binding protein
MTEKEHLDAQITVRVTDETYSKLEAQAKKEGKTKSDLIREAAEEKLAKHDKAK